MKTCPATIPGADGKPQRCVRMRGHRGRRCYAGRDIWFVSTEAERSAPDPVEPRIAHQHMCFAGGSVGAVALVSPDQDPEQYRKAFDVAATIELLEQAANALRAGDGVEATKAAGAAWFRISQFHKS